MKILVTGAAGFIGSHLCEKLILEGHQVVGVDNFDLNYARAIKEKNIASLNSNPSFYFRELDLCEDEALTKLLKDHSCDLVVHLAAKAGARLSLNKPLDYVDANVKATFSLLESMRINSIPHIIFTSSSAVYGKSTAIPFREDDLFEHAVSPYGSTKQCAELALKMYFNQYDFNVINLRLFSIYGPRQRPDLIIYKLMYALLTNRPMDFFGDEKIARDYTYVSDVVSGIHSAILRLENLKKSDKKLFETYNLGNSKAISLKELQNVLERITNEKALLLPKPETGADVPITYADITRAKTFLGYNPTVSLEDGLRKFKDWMIKEIL